MTQSMTLRKKLLLSPFCHQNENINSYLLNNYELDNVCTVLTYQEELGIVKGFKKKVNWKIALKLAPMKTISLLCLYSDFLFFSGVAVVEHFLHKC